MKAGPERNRLLSLLPQQVKERVFPLLHEIEMPLDKEIYGADQKAKFVYFPVDCIVSFIYAMLDGHTAEITVVGCEGIVGIPVILGGGSAPSQAIVQSAGTAYRLPATDLKREFENDATVRSLMLRYTQAQITQMTMTAVCNRHHSIEQQLCRWLLLSLDRLPTNELAMTQELIANMLGVRREGVTEAACKLQKLEVIRYNRGRIWVLDRPQLEALCCECYEVVKKETKRLLTDYT